MTKKIYVSGPMTGYPGSNWPAFHNAEDRLLLTGYDVRLPVYSATRKLTWEQYMRINIENLLKCDEIYMLSGWRDSKGAVLENHIAESLSMCVSYE